MTDEDVCCYYLVPGMLLPALISQSARSDTLKCRRSSAKPALNTYIRTTLLSSQEQIPVELADLRSQGKDKPATYKEMVAQKLISNNIAIFFERHGLK